MTRLRQLGTFVPCFALAIALTACGGGGSAGSPPGTSAATGGPGSTSTSSGSNTNSGTSTNKNGSGSTSSGGATSSPGTGSEGAGAGAGAARESVLYSFTSGVGTGPDGGLIFDGAGNLLGTTIGGGSSDDGTLFRLAPDGTMTVLHSFSGLGGTYPKGGLVADAAGNLFGTTNGQGPNGFGTIYELAPDGTFTTLYTFCSSGGDDCSSYFPNGGLVRDSQGMLYGTTLGGGAFIDSETAPFGGTVFRLAPDGTETVLYSFGSAGASDGSGPNGSLILDSAGNLYGTTSAGGANGGGTVFKLGPDGTETILYSFPSGVSGSGPYGGLIMDSAGNLYGTTTGGGTTGGGTVFQVAPDGTETTLYDFSSSPADVAGGLQPTGGLLLDGAGNLYGTTTNGGSNIVTGNGIGYGVVFRLSPGNGTYTETVLYAFGDTYTDGIEPYGALILDSFGDLYGTTAGGGAAGIANGGGTIFKLATGGSSTSASSSSTGSSTGSSSSSGSGSSGGTSSSSSSGSSSSSSSSGSNASSGVSSSGSGYSSSSSGTAAATLYLLAGNPAVAGSVDGIVGLARFNFNVGSGLASDSAGNIYVGDSGNNTIRKVTPSGVVTTLAGSPAPIGLQNGSDGTGAGASFLAPRGVATDGLGNVYVADCDNESIRLVTPDGVVTTLVGTSGSAGSADGVGSAARFYCPSGVSLDNLGNIYVADEANNTIRKISAGNVVTTLAGSPGVNGGADGVGAAAQFNQPISVACDGSGNVYVADNGSATIRKITPAGVVTTLAGIPGVQGDADGPGHSATFSNPMGLAVDAMGNIYVADTGNNEIRKITPDGIVSTVVGTGPGGGNFTPGPLPGFIGGPYSVVIQGHTLTTTSGNGVVQVSGLL